MQSPISSFESLVVTTLDRIHPDTGIDKAAAAHISEAIYYLTLHLLEEAEKHSRAGGKINCAHLTSAINTVLQGELARCSIIEATKLQAGKLNSYQIALAKQLKAIAKEVEYRAHSVAFYFLAGTIEYMTNELVKLAGIEIRNRCFRAYRDNKYDESFVGPEEIITVADFEAAMALDDELQRYFERYPF